MDGRLDGVAEELAFGTVSGSPDAVAQDPVIRYLVARIMESAIAAEECPVVEATVPQDSVTRYVVARIMESASAAEEAELILKKEIATAELTVQATLPQDSVNHYVVARIMESASAAEEAELILKKGTVTAELMVQATLPQAELILQKETHEDSVTSYVVARIMESASAAEEAELILKIGTVTAELMVQATLPQAELILQKETHEDSVTRYVVARIMDSASAAEECPVVQATLPQEGSVSMASAGSLGADKGRAVEFNTDLQHPEGGTPMADQRPLPELGIHKDTQPGIVLQDELFQHSRIDEASDIEHVLQEAMLPSSSDRVNAVTATEVPSALTATQEKGDLEMDLQDDLQDLPNGTERDIGALRARLEHTLFAKLDDGSLEEAIGAMSSSAGGATMSTEMPPPVLGTQEDRDLDVSVHEDNQCGAVMATAVPPALTETQEENYLEIDLQDAVQDVLKGTENDIDELRARLEHTLFAKLDDGSLEEAMGAMSSSAGGATMSTEMPPPLLETQEDNYLGLSSNIDDDGDAVMTTAVKPALTGTQEESYLEIDLQDNLHDMPNGTESDIGELRVRLEHTLFTKLDDGSLEEAVGALNSSAGGATMSTEMPPPLLETQEDRDVYVSLHEDNQCGAVKATAVPPALTGTQDENYLEIDLHDDSHDMPNGTDSDIGELRARLEHTLFAKLDDGSLEEAVGALNSSAGGATMSTEMPPPLLETQEDRDLDVSLHEDNQCGAEMATAVPPALTGTQEEYDLEIDLHDDLHEMPNGTESDIGELRARLEHTLFAKLDDGSLEEAMGAMSNSAGGATMSTEMPPPLLETQEGSDLGLSSYRDDGGDAGMAIAVPPALTGMQEESYLDINLQDDLQDKPNETDSEIGKQEARSSSNAAIGAQTSSASTTVRQPRATPKEKCQLIFKNLSAQRINEHGFKDELFQAVRKLGVASDDELSQVQIVLREASIIVTLQGPVLAVSSIRDEAATGKLEVMGCCAKVLPALTAQEDRVIVDDSEQLKKKKILEEGNLDWFHEPTRPPGRPTGPRRPLGSLATTTVAFSECSHVPRQESSLQLAFKAVQTFDDDLLCELLEKGAIKHEQLHAHDFVDANGNTLMEAAEAISNRPAISFFKKRLKSEPNFFDLPLLARNKLLLDGDFQKSSLLGKDVKIPSVELSYPLLPPIIKCGLSVNFPAQLEELVDDGNGSTRREPADPKLLLHFASAVELPPGLTLDERNGTILGTPTEEVWDFHVLVAVAVGLDIGATGKAVHSLCFQCRMAPTGLTYGCVQRVIDPSVSKFTCRLPQLSSSMPSRSLSRLSRSFRDSSSSRAGLEPTPTDFHAPAQSDGGFIEQFVIMPKLPHGLKFDVVTGDISGVPRETFRVPFSRTYEILGCNSAGMTRCKISLEIIAGSFGMYSMTVQTLGADDDQDSHGQSQFYQSAFCNSVMDYCCSEASVMSSPYSPTSEHQLMFTGQSNLSADSATSPLPRSPSRTSPEAKPPAGSLHFLPPPPRLPAPELPSQQEREAAEREKARQDAESQKVASEFSKLIPSWRATLKAKAQMQTLELMRRFRGKQTDSNF